MHLSALVEPFFARLPKKGPINTSQLVKWSRTRPPLLWDVMDTSQLRLSVCDQRVERQTAVKHALLKTYTHLLTLCATRIYMKCVYTHTYECAIPTQLLLFSRRALETFRLYSILASRPYLKENSEESIHPFIV